MIGNVATLGRMKNIFSSVLNIFLASRMQGQVISWRCKEGGLHQKKKLAWERVTPATVRNCCQLISKKAHCRKMAWQTVKPVYHIEWQDRKQVTGVGLINKNRLAQENVTIFLQTARAHILRILSRVFPCACVLVRWSFHWLTLIRACKRVLA